MIVHRDYLDTNHSSYIGSLFNGLVFHLHNENDCFVKICTQDAARRLHQSPGYKFEFKDQCGQNWGSDFKIETQIAESYFVKNPQCNEIIAAYSLLDENMALLTSADAKPFLFYAVAPGNVVPIIIYILIYDKSSLF